MASPSGSWLPHNIAAGFQRRVPQEREPGGSCCTFYDPDLEVTQCHFHQILFVRSSSLRLAHIQGEGVRFHLLIGRRSKNLQLCLNITTVAYGFFPIHTDLGSFPFSMPFSMSPSSQDHCYNTCHPAVPFVEARPGGSHAFSDQS